MSPSLGNLLRSLFQTNCSLPEMLQQLYVFGTDIQNSSAVLPKYIPELFISVHPIATTLTQTPIISLLDHESNILTGFSASALTLINIHSIKQLLSFLKKLIRSFLPILSAGFHCIDHDTQLLQWSIELKIIWLLPTSSTSSPAPHMLTHYILATSFRV